MVGAVDQQPDVVAHGQARASDRSTSGSKKTQ
jgi:hypothetical protein